jgi:glycosyltransferase involved in cell wall biosynthesis
MIAVGVRRIRVSLLSVIMPNFNHGRLIGRALDALAAQERLPDQIIVIDDASTDESLLILDRYRERLPQLVVLKNEFNLGANASVQRGLEAASSRYVYFAAADDWVLPGFFDKALAVLEANRECGFVCGDALLLNGDTGEAMGYRPAVRPSQREGKLSPDMTARLLRTADNFIMSGSAVFRRDAIMEKGGFDARAGSFSDGLLVRKIALTYGFCFVPRVFAVWNIFAQGYSRSTALDAERARKALEALPALIEQDPDFPEWYPAVFRRRWRFGAARLALQAEPPNLAIFMEIGAASRSDRRILSLLSRWMSFPPVRFLSVAFLAVRLEPYRLRDLMATAVARRLTLRSREIAPRRRPGAG